MRNNFRYCTSLVLWYCWFCGSCFFPMLNVWGFFLVFFYPHKDLRKVRETMEKKHEKYCMKCSVNWKKVCF